MSNIYCSNCGTKHLIGSKFCTNCGNSLGGFSNVNKPSLQTQIINKKNISDNYSEVDEDGIPTTFRKPSRLHYEIEKPKNKYTGQELFNAPPIDDSEKSVRRPINYKKLTKEEFLSQSLKECSSRPIQDIDES